LTASDIGDIVSIGTNGRNTMTKANETLAERAVRMLEGTDGDSGWSGSYAEITAWLASIGIVAMFTDVDRWTTGWVFPDGSMACEEIRECWPSADAMREDLEERASEERSYYDI
jgi:hypothetical protein